ncbi:MAG: hypothetical protein HC850_06875 [Rhodomicrobium sp.]|nr:hypothetical protein [Rhodomicrobium sp.]
MSTSRIQRGQGERLDVVLQRLRDDEEIAPVDGADELRAFVKGLRSVGDRPEDARPSSESLLIDFVMPIISDARIFEESHTIALFEYLRDELLPFFHDNEELTYLATKVIDDEIQRYNFVLERRQSGIAA